MNSDEQLINIKADLVRIYATELSPTTPSSLHNKLKIINI